MFWVPYHIITVLFPAVKCVELNVRTCIVMVFLIFIFW